MRYQSLAETVGRTPMIELRTLSPKPDVRLFAKLEGFNPTGSVKDRIVKLMLERAEGEGLIEPGGTIIEASTGNTGIALAMMGRTRGYSIEVVMPQNVYPEIPRMLAVYGAALHWTPAEDGMHGALASARDMAQAGGHYMLDQFTSEHNAHAHYLGTAQEIIDDVGVIDVFVAGIGTAGTIMGAGRRLKEHNPEVRLVAVEPYPANQVQGLRSLAEGFIPPILDLDFIDGKLLVRGEQALRRTLLLMEREAIFAGVSSGAVLHAALRVAEKLSRGNIVMIFADSGWKYLGSRLWTEEPQPSADDLDAVDDVIWW
jgi:cysteine synthase B